MVSHNQIIVNGFRDADYFHVNMAGGGVSGQKERLTAPLQAVLDREMFAPQYAPVKVTVATLGSAAGGYGAAALVIED